MTLQEIQAETKKDPFLQSLIKAIETNRWTDSDILDYKRLKGELLVYSGVVLGGNNRCPKQAERKSRRPGACWALGYRKDQEFNP